ncbi:hypothetical protein VTN77DRAFT_433 [Rasamsonia byssochlamydoides]|uniref:uncharacterized protein n=1 Tax=Rasamsonia byssochlamydoides TaxID=89139 RepID=UPI0037439861
MDLTKDSYRPFREETDDGVMDEWLGREANPSNLPYNPSVLSVLLQRKTGNADGDSHFPWFVFGEDQKHLEQQEQPSSPEPSGGILMGNLHMPLLMFTDDEADTLVYIDPAPRHPQPDNFTQIIPHQLHSRSLLKPAPASSRNISNRDARPGCASVVL